MDKIIIKGARVNNLKNIDIELPKNKLIVMTGVSGSGKSTLINDTLQPILSQHFYRSLQNPLAYDRVEGLEYIDKVVNVDQSPLGRTPRSNPATYTGVFSDIRNLFVNLPEAKIRGYKAGRFSFNVSGGRCETCSGNGYKTIEMNFLPDVMVPCETCHGKRYNRETLEVRFKGKSIADVLDMTINRAVEFFENVPSILNKIKVLQEVGLGYIKLGQPSTTLSGGESQRVKLATELSKKDTGKTIYMLSRVRLFATPWTIACQASLSITNSRSLLKLVSVMSSNHLILYWPLLLPPSNFLSIRVFSNESVLCIRWPKHWSFSFSISSSNEYSGLISFRIDWFDSP